MFLYYISSTALLVVNQSFSKIFQNSKMFCARLSEKFSFAFFTLKMAQVPKNDPIYFHKTKLYQKKTSPTKIKAF